METEFKFIGRVEQLQDLLKILQDKQYPVYVIHGPPGSGKSIYVNEVYKKYKTAEQDSLQCGERPAELVHIDCRTIRRDNVNLEFAKNIMTGLSEQDKYCLSIRDDDTQQKIVFELVKAVTLILKKLHPQHVFFFIDNIDMTWKNISLTFVVEMFRQREKPRNLSCILTSNLKLSSPNIKVKLIKMEKFTDDEAKQLFVTNFNLDPDKEFVKYVNEICSGNPEVLQLVGTDLASDQEYLSQEDIQHLLRQGRVGDVVNRDNLAESEQWYTRLKEFFEKRLPKLVPERLKEVMHFDKEFRAEDLTRDSGDPGEVAMTKSRLVPAIRSSALDYDPKSRTMTLPPINKSYMTDQNREKGQEKNPREYPFSQSPPASAASCPEKIPNGSIKEKFSGLTLKDVEEACEEQLKFESRPAPSDGRCEEEQTMNHLSPGGPNVRSRSVEVPNISENDPQIVSNLNNSEDQKRAASKYVEDQKRKLEVLAKSEDVGATVSETKTNLPSESVLENQVGQLDNNISENTDDMSRQHAASDASTEDNTEQHSERTKKMNSMNTESIENNEDQPCQSPTQVEQLPLGPSKDKDQRSLTFYGQSGKLPEVKSGHTGPEQRVLSVGLDSPKQFPDPSPQLACVGVTADEESAGVPFDGRESLNIASVGPKAMTQRTIEAYAGRASLQKQTALDTSDWRSKIHDASELQAGTRTPGDSNQYYSIQMGPHQSVQSAYADLMSNQRHNSGALSVLQPQAPDRQVFDQQASQLQWVQPPMTGVTSVYQSQPTNLYGSTQRQQFSPNLMTHMQVRMRPVHSNTDFSNSHPTSNMYQQLQPDTVQRQLIANQVYHQPRAPSTFVSSNDPMQFSVPQGRYTTPVMLQSTNTGQQTHTGLASIDLTLQSGNVFWSDQSIPLSHSLHQHPQQQQQQPQSQQQQHPYYQQQQPQQQQWQQHNFQQQQQLQHQQWQQHYQQQEQLFDRGPPYQQAVDQEVSVPMQHNLQHSGQHSNPSVDLHGNGLQHHPDQYGRW